MGQNPIIAGGVESRISIYQSTPNEEHAVGTRSYMPDGRVFYWVRNESGASMLVGKLHLAALVVAGNINQVSLVNAIGTTALTFTVGATSVTANQYKDGYLYVNAGTGIGQTFKIRDHAAFTNGTTATFNLYDGIPVALDATSRISLRKNLYDNPIASATIGGTIVGVPAFTLATATRGWAQTWGPCATLGGAVAMTTGGPVVQSVVTAGAVDGAVAGTLLTGMVVGMAIDALVSTEYRAVDLRIRQ